MSAQQQYNGLILLTSYIQRIYIAEKINERIGVQTNPSRLQAAKNYLDELNMIMPLFEQTRELTDTQLKRVKEITMSTKHLMDGYFPQPPFSFVQKLSIVGSSLYGEQLMNTGVLRLGQLFQKEVGKDFEMRVKFYKERTEFIDAVVHTLYSKEEIELSLQQIIANWFEGIMANRKNVLQDMEKINPFFA
ncbi:hypothetical protein [Metasolibacillus fluoroglycofenilyticus]|uniref:hypothetical protein n=1 Tax=Metasolibacillus fluoroglycofenilyticus TaxID=1239396 RepID=UPI000D39C127|nr:hypothetical protein [Metasolibacillus fluoroglycofenilyticus]